MLKSADDSRFADHKRGQTKCYRNGNDHVIASLMTSLQVNVVIHLLQMQLWKTSLMQAVEKHQCDYPDF